MKAGEVQAAHRAISQWRFSTSGWKRAEDLTTAKNTEPEDWLTENGFHKQVELSSGETSGALSAIVFRREGQLAVALDLANQHCIVQVDDLPGLVELLAKVSHIATALSRD